MRYVESLNAALHRLFESDDRVFLIGEDLLDPYGGAFKVSKGLSTKFPDRVITTPISESGLVGMSTGLALRGFRPIAEIMFGDFLALACDQIVNSAVKFPSMYNGKVTVPLVIRAAMGGRRGYGPTHSQTLEPMFFNVPELTIVAPSHLHDPGKQLSTLVTSTERVALFIENKLLYPVEILHSDANEIDVFSVERIEHGSHPGHDTIRVSIRGGDEPSAILVGYGGMVPVIMEAMKTLFMEDEIATALYAPSIVKPLPVELPGLLAAKKLPVVVCEESPRYSGWGAEVIAQIAEDYSGQVPVGGMQRIGAADMPIPCCRELEDAALPQASDIVAAVRGVIQ